jgi:DNA-directed RNA polymerase subunit RPC12/RpoP
MKERQREIEQGLRRWAEWVVANQSQLKVRANFSVPSRKGWSCENCKKEYIELPKDLNNRHQNRCTRCGYQLAAVFIAGTFNHNDMMAEVYNTGIQLMPQQQRQAIYWKYLSKESQSKFAAGLGISTQHLQQNLSRSYYYLMGYLDWRKYNAKK